ncbi:MAG TPA: SpoIIE family protein phosphatase [Pseudonocardia sp.]|nr:SpoIIE family protein phosphatase [Pseudonocardia sp.]
MSDQDGRGSDDGPVAGAPDFFARVIESVPVGVIGYRGPDHVVVGANRAARAFFDDRPGIVGRPIREVYPEIIGQNVWEYQERVRTTGEPFSAHEWRMVVDGPDGPVERFVDFDLVPVREPDGSVSGVACSFQDVTEGVIDRRELAVQAAELRERYRSAQDTVLALQRSLLPGRLPVLPGFRLAARYLVAAAEQAAGGDWFDVIPVDGRIVAVVGDVVGHGAAASAVMGQLRAMLTEYLLDGDDLAVVLSRLDRFASRNPGARAATVCLAMLDPDDGSMRYACAGHPPPLVAHPDGSTEQLAAPVGVPLGVAGPQPRAETVHLSPGDLLVCYSDGLVERADEPLSEGVGKLATVTTTAVLQGAPSLAEATAADRVAELIMERMTRDGYVDDVTLLVVEVTGRAAKELHADLPAEPGRLAELRESLREWLDDLGASDQDVVAIELAVLEAAANVVEHAYPDSEGRMVVEGTVDGDGRVYLTVSDTGRWREAGADPGTRGRGLLMMRGSMDSVDVEIGEDGTTVLLDRQLSNAPILGPGSVAQHASSPGGPGSTRAKLAVSLERSDEPRLVVAGPVDISTVTSLRGQLWSAARGGALPLTVDLSGVTHLASAGIALLFEFVEDTATGGREVRLVAPGGCPARSAMAVSGLDQVASVEAC